MNVKDKNWISLECTVGRTSTYCLETILYLVWEHVEIRCVPFRSSQIEDRYLKCFTFFKSLHDNTHFTLLEVFDTLILKNIYLVLLPRDKGSLKQRKETLYSCAIMNSFTALLLIPATVTAEASSRGLTDIPYNE